MSGICGVVHFDGRPADRELVRRMADASAFRGPDGIRMRVDGSTAFTHLALNLTVESKRERQPLTSRDGRLLLTADARVDNRSELLAALHGTAHLQIAAPTDADLILGAYSRWGEGCPERIAGDFAFAVWDASERTLFLARDAVGARPLFFTSDGTTVRFASDVAQILTDQEVDRELDGFALSDFLTLNFVPSPRTAYAAVRRLLPGHCMLIGREGVRSRRHWNPETVGHEGPATAGEWVEAFRALLLDSTRARLRGVDGAAIQLSGGLDSSSIAAAAEHLATSGQAPCRPVGVTVVFPTLPSCDEREYARATADHCGLVLREIDAERHSIVRDTFDRAPLVDGPAMFHDSLGDAVVATARESGCRVLLNGFGGDSLFDAAIWQPVDHARSGAWWRALPWIAATRADGASWRRAVGHHLVRPIAPRWLTNRLDRGARQWRSWQTPPWLTADFTARGDAAARRSRRRYPVRFRRAARQGQYEHIVGLAQQLNPIEFWNRRAAHQGVELAMPLLDRRLAELVLSAPIELSARPGAAGTKWLLRASMQGLLPETVRTRRGKAGWGAYIRGSIRRELGPDPRSRLGATALGRAGVVDDLALTDELAHSFEGRSRVPNMAFLATLAAEQWLAERISRPRISFNMID